MKIFCVMTFAFFMIANASAYESKSGFENANNYYTGSATFSGKTCSESGCHTGSASTGSVFDMSFPGLVWSAENQAFLYSPSQTYSMAVELKNDTGIGSTAQNGFVVEIIDSLGQPAGTIVTDSTTQTSDSGAVVLDSDSSSRVTMWTFQWTAPASGKQGLVLYAAAVDGDGDGNENSGDIADAGFTKLLETSITNSSNGTTGCGAITALPSKDIAISFIMLIALSCSLLGYRKYIY